MTTNDPIPAPFPQKRMAAGALLFNTEGALLIVKPTYRPGWLLPGGMIEDGESPRTACERELREELGLTIRVRQLRGVEYQSGGDGRRENVQFVFDSGVLSGDQIAQIVIPPDELAAYALEPVDVALTLLNPWSSRRVSAILRAGTDVCIYLEDGPGRGTAAAPRQGGPGRRASRAFTGYRVCGVRAAAP